MIVDYKAATPTLTAREYECLTWAAMGKTAWEIARIMKCSQRTVAFHKTNIISKFHASNIRQCVATAVSQNLIRMNGLL